MIFSTAPLVRSSYRRPRVVELVDALEVGDVLELERVGHVHLLPDVLVHHVDVRLVDSVVWACLTRTPRNGTRGRERQGRNVGMLYGRAGTQVGRGYGRAGTQVGRGGQATRKGQQHTRVCCIPSTPMYTLHKTGSVLAKKECTTYGYRCRYRCRYR